MTLTVALTTGQHYRAACDSLVPNINGGSPWENFEIFEIALGDFLAKNLYLSFFLKLLIMSVGLLGGGKLKLNPHNTL